MKPVIMMSLLAFSVSANAVDLLVVTGREGGSYFSNIGPKVVKNMKAVGLSSEFVSSGGSLDNLEKVAKGEAQIGISQADAISYFKKTNPQLAQTVEIGVDVGDECAFLVSKKGGKVTSDDNLQTKGISISVGAKGDGSRATWDFMATLEPKFKNSQVFDFGGATGLSKVLSGASDAFLFVTNPDEKVLFNNEIFKFVSSNKNLQFVPITDWDLNDKLPNGDAVYTFKKVTIGKGSLMDDKVETICMNAYTIYNDSLSPEVKEKMSKGFMNLASEMAK